MTKSRLIHHTALAAALGGGAWLTKIAIIAATDGGDNGAVAAFYLAGVVLLAAGAATITLRLARGRATTIGAVLLGPVVFFASYVVLESIGKALVGDTDPQWVGEEIGIAITGAFWLAVGAVLARAAAAPDARMR